MSRPSKSNVPAAALRWSAERAGIEFGLSSTTLRKALARNSTAPDANGLYTTAQIISALFGELQVERLRTQRARARQIELENAITEARVLDRASLATAFAAIADAFTSRLYAAIEIPRTVRDDLLRDLATWPLALENVAHRQTRLRNNNGDAQAHVDNGSDSDSSDYEKGSGIATTHRRKSTTREKRR